MTVERIDHIHILVKDLEGATKFFSNIMGTRFILLDHRPKHQLRHAFDSMGLELMSPTSLDSPWGEVMEKEGEGLVSIGLKVTDLDQAISEFEAKGLKLWRRSPPDGVIKFAQFYPAENSYGVRFELVEYDTIQPVAIANVYKLSELLPWFNAED